MARIVLYILIIILTLKVSAQVQLTPVLVGSAGGFHSFSGGSISSSAGEAVVFTINNTNNILTQGFHQPFAKQQAFSVNINTYPSTCNASNNGALKVLTDGGIAPFKFEYQYYDSINGYTPLNNVADSIDSLSALKPGNYIVSVTDFYNRTYADTINIGIENEGDCKLKIYTGFSPNGDGVNDTWIIDGIEFYPDNSVFIYNRWGEVIWQNKGYDNKNIVWDGRWQYTGELLVNGTYFYLIYLPNQEFKGWVELTR